MNKTIEAFCEAKINGEYLKTASESVIFRDETGYILFDFTINHPNENNCTVFTIRMEFKKDSGTSRVYYNLDKDDESTMIITVYNVINNDTLISDMQKIYNIAGIDFYISHKIYSNSVGYKEVTMELYAK